MYQRSLGGESGDLLDFNRKGVYKLRRDAGRRKRCFWMMPAKARSASLASRALGNAAATSGSSTTTALPAAYRDAYLLGEARLKSYSGRISSAPTCSVALPLVDDLFIVSPLTPCGPSRANDANGFAPFYVHDCKQMLVLRKAQQHKPLFLGRMTRIGY